MRVEVLPRFSLAEKTGFAAFLVALLLGIVSPLLAVIPLFVFLLACLCAPFFPQFPFFLPLICRGNGAGNAISLTFDDGPAPSSTPLLLNLLAQHHLPATFFVVGRNAAAHPDLIRMILDHGHTIGNHSYEHDSFLMLRNSQKLARDISATQDILLQSGIQPLLFRPPVGITNPRLGRVLTNLGLKAVTFRFRIYDRGNKNISRLAVRVLRSVQPGDILLLHDADPLSGETATWLNELDCLFSSLKKTYQIIPLADLIDRPVMHFLTEKAATE
jgi:peptidoglycan/xylan/chitin deacetylase (PgdA/CDA1 family)